MAQAPTSTESQVRVSRTIRASRQRVFRAWTEPELMMRWFVEGDAEMRVCRIDLRPGGRYLLEGHVRGKPWTIRGEYREVRPPERLVYTWAWENDSKLGEPTGGDTLVTVEFRDLGRETELVVTHERFVSAKARDEHNLGWKECIDRLARLAEGTEELS